MDGCYQSYTVFCPANQVARARAICSESCACKRLVRNTRMMLCKAISSWECLAVRILAKLARDLGNTRRQLNSRKVLIFVRFPCTTPSYLGNNFSAPTGRSILVVSLRFHPLLFQEQTKSTGFQDTRTETSRRRRRRRRVLPLLSRITTNPSAPSPLSIDHLDHVPVPQAAARHLRRIWFEARREDICMRD